MTMTDDPSEFDPLTLLCIAQQECPDCKWVDMSEEGALKWVLTEPCHAHVPPPGVSR